MAKHASRISLLEAEPELAEHLPSEERAGASRLSVPVIQIPRGPVDVPGLLEAGRAFGGVVLSGMLFSHHRSGAHTALQLLGPGDLLAVPGAGATQLLSTATVSAAAPTTVALFGTEVLVAARRWPRIVAGFYVRVAEQADRLTAQLTICQFPRVDQRLLAMFWLLAESWGQVTSAGTRLPLNLTHDVLGTLVGARRPTVTLALGELVERGAIVRQERGWLLLEAPAETPDAPPPAAEHEVLIDDPPSAWEASSTATPATDQELHEELLATVKRLRREHLATRDHVRSRLEELAAQRARAEETRRQIAADAVTRRRAPS